MKVRLTGDIFSAQANVGDAKRIYAWQQS